MDRDQTIVRPSGHIYVCATTDHVPDAFTPCVLGEHFKLEPKALGTFLRLKIPARAEDLLVIAGAIAFVDRRVTRHHATCWERDLHLSVPVRDFEFWNANDLRAELSALLEMLTGDTWYLTFRSGRAPLPIDPQDTLSLASTPPIVIPYSNGLDSFAVARLHSKPGQNVIRVSTGRIGDTEKKTDNSHVATTRWVSMPISLPNGGWSLREQSYRSRGFLFGAVAATAAGLMQGTEVVVPESGQGTFGPALTVIGHEHPDVRMSPVFTSVFGRFISRVFERSIKFVHPRIWSTKGETLAALREAGLSDGWEKTVSCSRGSRQSVGQMKARHCGLCANCVLRRQSLLASGLSGEMYIWPDLAAGPPWTIGNGAVPGKSEIQQAISAALAMHEFAILDTKAKIVVREAKAMAAALGESDDVAIGGVNNVLRAHRQEWLSFVGTFPSASLFRELGALS
jgi:hypothetical protein